MAALACGACVFAQQKAERDYSTLKALSWGIGLPVECRDLPSMGLYDMDMVLPVEVRFGRFINSRWYIMGELTWHASLAAETATIEPALRVGCNFGTRRHRTKK